MPDLSRFFIAPPDGSLLYAGHYDLTLVSLSLAVAVLASYAALLVSQHIAQAATVTHRRLWAAIGGACLGLGIWAMHFVGMLAFSLPCATGYDTGLTLLSVAPSVLACALALALISRPSLSTRQILAGGLLLGSGIGAMHYAGMGALRIEGLVRYDPVLVVLSLLVAVLLAALAIWIRSHLQGRWPRQPGRAVLASACVMGLAVSGMHYTAMAAAYFLRDGDASVPASEIGPTLLAGLVAASTVLISVTTMVAAHIARPNLLSAVSSYRMVGTLIVLWCALAWVGMDRFHAKLINELYQAELDAGNTQIQNLVRHLDETVRGIKGIPQVIANQGKVQRALHAFKTQAGPSTLPYAQRKRRLTQDPQLSVLNQSLFVAASQLPIDAIWVIDKAGDCIAASNFDRLDSHVGANYAKQEYFKQARAGHRWQQYAFDLISKTPGLFYAYPVLEGGAFMGVVVVKRNLANLSNWVTQADTFVTDANGVVVLAENKAFQSRTLPESRVLSMSDAELRQQYNPAVPLKPLRIEPWGDPELPLALRIEHAQNPSLLLSQTLPDGVFTVHIHKELAEVVRLQAQKTWLALLLALAGGMLIVAVSSLVMYLRESKKMQADLRIAATAFNSHDAMMITDAQGVILRVNQAFTSNTGYDAEEAIGQTPKLLRSDRHDAAFYAAMWDSLNRTGVWQGEIWNRRKNGQIFPQWMTITAVKGHDGRVSHYVGMHTDITERKSAEEEIRYLAFYDPLTDLPNRRLLLDRLRQALATSTRSGQQGALLFIDLDNFKTLNDTRGHDKGDLLLQEVAKRLLTCVRAEDTVARLGGDEFVVMLEKLSPVSEEAATQTRLVGEKIIATLNQPYQLGSHDHHSTPSIGITLFSDHRDTVDDLLKRADLAMYQAKAAGRNTLRFFDPNMQAAISTRAALEADFRASLKAQEFVLHYQGQVNALGQLVGVEALVRWRHPRRGLVPPAEFIPLAEETGLIMPLGQWIMQTACQQLGRWAARPETQHLSLSVNVSGRQFQHPDFVAQLLAVIDATHANPQRLKLEITETLLLNDAEDVIAKMMQLKTHGIGFALDDFGTGYSSLSYLKRLPLDQLKIDQSFVRDVFTDANDAAIVGAIITLARSLGLSVIAEGVETEAQRGFLLSQGCSAYQGYLFGEPGPVESLPLSPPSPASVSTTGA